LRSSLAAVSANLQYLNPLVLDSASSIPSIQSRAPQWPILDQILWEWHQSIEIRGGIITGDILLEKARQIWPRIPEYANQEEPTFSRGWLTRFKARHKIKKHQFNGEAGSVNLVNIAEEMRAIQTLCGEYQEDEIFNADETGLYWKQSPKSGLSTQVRPGKKADKSRITLMLCSNSTKGQYQSTWLNISRE